MPFNRLDDLALTEMAFKEAMRLAPPVPSLPRRAVRDLEFMGFHIPAGTGVNINPLYTHYMPRPRAAGTNTPSFRSAVARICVWD